MLKLCRDTKVKVFFLVLVYVFNFDLFEFSAAILEKVLLPGASRNGPQVICSFCLYLASSLPVRLRIHLCYNLGLLPVVKIYLSLTENKRQHCAHDETKPHKTCLFLIL